MVLTKKQSIPLKLRPLILALLALFRYPGQILWHHTKSPPVNCIGNDLCGMFRFPEKLPVNGIVFSHSPPSGKEAGPFRKKGQQKKTNRFANRFLYSILLSVKKLANANDILSDGTIFTFLSVRPNGYR